jgi:hypothetical protein
LAPLSGAWAPFPVMVGTFVVVGMTSALTRSLGFGNAVSCLVVGVPSLAVLTVACRNWCTDRKLAGWTVLSMYLGAIIFFSTAGLARGRIGPGPANASRYVYVVIALLLPGLALVISQGVERHNRLIRAVVPVAIAIAVSNIFQLFTFSAEIRYENDASRRVLFAASDLVRSNDPVFANQLPEPLLAPSVTTNELMSGHLIAAFDNIRVDPADRLTASLNLQVQVSPKGGVTPLSTCRDHAAQRITIPITRGFAPTFMVAADTKIVLTLRNHGSTSAQRPMDLAGGNYIVGSVGDGGDLTIQSTAGSPTLVRC